MLDDDVIRELVHMDEEARATVERAEHQRDEMKAKMKKETDEVEAAYIGQAKHKIAQLKEQAQQDSAQQIEEINRCFEAAQKTLADSYTQNQARWVGEIVSRCKGVGVQ